MLLRERLEMKYSFHCWSIKEFTGVQRKEKEQVRNTHVYKIEVSVKKHLPGNKRQKEKTKVLLFQKDNLKTEFSFWLLPWTQLLTKPASFTFAL